MGGISSGGCRTIEDIKRYNAELRKRAQKKEDLIVPVDFTVESVLGYNSGTGCIPIGPIVMGGHTPTRQVGDYSALELQVNSAKTQVKKLSFNGWPPIEAGDKIRAYIFIGEEKKEMPTQGFEYCGQSHYIQREFKKQETAVKIEKLKKGKVVATYTNK